MVAETAFDKAESECFEGKRLLDILFLCADIHKVVRMHEPEIVCLQLVARLGFSKRPERIWLNPGEERMLLTRHLCLLELRCTYGLE